MPSTSTPPTSSRASTSAGCCTPRATSPGRRPTTGTPYGTTPPAPSHGTTWACSSRTPNAPARPPAATSAPGGRGTPSSTWRSTAASSRVDDEHRAAHAPRGADAHLARARRHLGLQLPRVARDLLPRGPLRARDARLLRAAARHGGDQLHLPALPDSGPPRRLGPADARRLPLRAQGPATHHPPAPAPRRGRARPALLSARHHPRPEARAAALPAAALPALRRRAARGLPRPAAPGREPRLRVPRRELVPGRDLRAPDPAPRRALHRRQRGVGHTRRGDGALRLPAASPRRL